MRTAALLCALSAATLSAAPARAEGPVLLKLATLAPEGSSWMKLFHRWADNVAARTEGRVKVKFFAGGVQGDERDVLRKIRLGQLSGAAFTSIGLTSICPEVRVFDVARTEAELDQLRAALGDRVKLLFEKNGFFLGGWGDVGPIHLFSNIPVRSLEDVKKLKLWKWNDDPISAIMFAAFDIHGVPMGVPEVLPGLATGQIDAVFGTPLSTLALQWNTHVKYMTSLNVGYATGATVFAKKALEPISLTDMAILAEEGQKLTVEAQAQVRKDNRLSVETLKKQGIQVIEVPKEFESFMLKRGEELAREQAKKFPPEFSAEVERVIFKGRKK